LGKPEAAVESTAQLTPPCDEYDSKPRCMSELYLAGQGEKERVTWMAFSARPKQVTVTACLLPLDLHQRFLMCEFTCGLTHSGQ
jgi:hypothetical protein